jgi:hypothetical protein
MEGRKRNSEFIHVSLFSLSPVLRKLLGMDTQRKLKNRAASRALRLRFLA